MPTKPKAMATEPSQIQTVQFTPDQVQEVQEAIRRAERDMNDWREKSRVDPEKMKVPLAR